MPRLTSFLLRHKLAVVAAWLVVLAAGGAAAGVVPSRLSQEFSFPGEEGYEANVAILEAYGNGGPGDPLVPVVTLPDGTTVDSPGVRDALGQAFDGVAADPRLRVLAWPATTDDRRLVVDGGRTVYGLVWGPFTGPEGGDPAIAEAVAGGARQALPAGTVVQVTGLDQLRATAAEEPAGTGVLVETLVGGLGALVVLAFVFGSFLALVPLLIAAVAILTTFLAVLGLTGVVEVSFIVQFLVALIGLGVAVDYSLLVVTRWREELAAGHDREQAVHRAMATAGRAVVTSGGTVAVGLLALVLLPVPFLRSIGYAGLLIPLAATLATLTLLPVLLASVGPRLDWPAGRRARRRDPARQGRAAGRLWTGWAAGVARHRWLAALAALAVLVPLGVAALGLRLGEPPAAVLAQSGPAREALDRLERAGVGSGVLTPIEVLVPAGTDRQAAADRLAGVAGVQLAVAPTGPAWQRDDSGLVSVLPAAETSGDEGEATVERVRDLVAAELPGARVGGSGALAIDATASLYGSFPLMLAAVAVVTFVLLARAFRSLLLAFKAILLNLLSIGAAYGVLVLVWQEGYGSEAIWGIPATGAIAMWVPLMAFAFLYGLSMDYEVFLLARMREEYDGTGSTETAIVQGLGRVGRLVTCAALILFLSFASMAAIPELDVKIMATALGAGILLDATVLRALLVPALVALLGRWNWWLPSWAAGALRLPASVPAPEPAEPARSGVGQNGPMPYLVKPVVPAGRMRDRSQPVLRGAGGLVLRPWEPADAPVVLEAYQDPAIRRWNLRRFGSLAEAGAWIVQWDRQWQAERDGCWAVADGDGTVLGRVALRGIRLADGVADCTYWVLPAARGRGVATGATVAVARWALHELGLHRLELQHSTANPASCRVAAKAGFAPEGTLRSAMLHPDGWHDMHLHARVASDR